jgi:peptidoglycan/xylan/chitin deacetylase (PgdA/CDA1 family)
MLRSRELLRRVAYKSVAKTIRMRNQRPVVSFTFDDFPRSAALNGARILERHGARGTFYVAGSYCGKVVDGVVQYCAEDLSALSHGGHEIGCHTFNHRRVSSLAANALVEEFDLKSVSCTSSASRGNT